MDVKYFNTDFFNLSKEPSLRFDIQYIKSNAGNDDFTSNFKLLFDFVSKGRPNITEISNFLYAEIGNVDKTGSVEPVNLSFDNRNIEDDNYYKKIEKGDIILPQKGDILLSSIRPYLNKNVLIEDENVNIYFTKAFIQIRPKIKSRVLYYSLRTVFFNKLISASRQGKGYPTLKENDLKTIYFSEKILENLVKNQFKLEKKILEIEKGISKLKQKIKKPESVINEVLARELEIDLNKFEQFKRVKNISLDFNNIANNIDLRYSYKFHNKANLYITNLLEKQTDKKIKDYISEPIVLGKGISPKEYDKNGDYFYVAMSSIKTWAFEEEGCKKTNDEYAKNNLHKSIKKGDIIMARSGEGTIGKVALITDDTKGIFADFTMRIRLKNFDTQLAYYYFRSEYFQYLVYSHKKGLGNNTNIFPSQIKEFPMPDWDTKKQKRITKTIKTQLDKQENYKNLILNKQKEISQMIEETRINQ